MPLSQGGMDTESGRESITNGVAKIDAILQNMSRSLHFTNCIMGAKAQSGMPAAIGTRTRSCAAVLNAPRVYMYVRCSGGLTAGAVMFQWHGSTTQPKILSC